MLGATNPHGPLLLDTNVFLNALTGRGPRTLQALLVNLPQSFVSAATVAVRPSATMTDAKRGGPATGTSRPSSSFSRESGKRLASSIPMTPSWRTATLP